LRRVPDVVIVRGGFILKGIEMTYEQIRYENKKNIAIITMNRPEKLNAWTYVIARELRDALYKAEADQSVRAIVLTGAGRGFCSGADISELQGAPDRGVDQSGQTLSPERQVSVLMMTRTEEELDPINAKGNRDDFRRRFSYLLGLQKPIIAAINGHCIGLGLIITLFCDIRFASEKAKFSTAFSKRGLIAEHGISWILPRITGISNALDLLFSSRLIEADRR
jgi:enoyl-CoA hydratase/carnithine racemase